LTTLDDDGVLEILDAVRAHGIVVIKGQNLTRAAQVEFTSKLGEVIVLPSSFEGKDPEPFHPAIQRITNFWANNTWVCRTEVDGKVNTIVSL
jgi:taurine dioxygenase